VIRLNIHEAKTHLSRHLRRLKRGESILLCRRNIPVAEIRPLQPPPGIPRRHLGGFKGRIRIPPSFFKPLPDDILEAFYGGRL
jgi:antitoxin (DNA-binding transcriptional repressor) of toxin-antitoxin stability system